MKPPSFKLSQEGRAIDQKLASKELDPLTVFREHMAAGTASQEISRVCLMTFYESLRHLNYKQRTESIKEHSVGALTLQWLWQSDKRWVALLSSDLKFLNVLCYLLEVEGYGDFVMDWIRAEVEQAAREHFKENEKVGHAWRGWLFRGLIAAKLHLGLSDGDASPALQAFFQVVREKENASPDVPFADMSLWPAQTELVRQLTLPSDQSTSRYPKTDGALYLRFINGLSSYSHSRIQSDYKAATLWLCHPQEPEPDYMYTHIQREFAADGLKGMSEKASSDESWRSNVSSSLIMTIGLLQERGRPTDAEWVLWCRKKILGDQLVRRPRPTKHELSKRRA